LAILLASTLVGCAANSYVAPQADDSPTLTGYKVERDRFDWEHYSVDAIDNKHVREDMISGRIIPADATYALTPGMHKVLVRGFFNRARGGEGPYEAEVVVVADFAPRTAYQVRGEVVDDLVRAWVTEVSSGRSVSEASAAPFRVFTGAPSFFIGPVFR
jgi:hypothetical protein